MLAFSMCELEAAAALVHREMQPTPQYSWPLLNARLGAEVWVKHENVTPTGAFKFRGAVTFIAWLRRAHPEVRGIVTATRGNHGQGQARSATRAGLIAKIVVPRRNSPEKNAAMRAWGAELIEFGDDFDTARGEAQRIAMSEGLLMVPPFHRELVRGVATYAYELFTAVSDLHTVYVPIGCGSGICGVIAARDALGLPTKVVGVVSSEAPCAKLSFESGRLTETASAHTFADGMAVRVPVAEAFEVYAKGADRIIAVSDHEVAHAIRTVFTDTHHVAEGAGAAPLAALMQEHHAMKGRKVGVILCGSNIDSAKFADVLAGRTPQP
ncbi:MAG: threonine dehydratase [Hyphomicrobiaceae bacterium]